MLLVTALFTKDDGNPATGLTLTDIDLYLYSRARADGTVATVWNGENPAEEVGGGVYSKAYTSEDETTYTYSAYAHYTGATSLDSIYSLQAGAGGPAESLVADAVHDEVVEGTYTLRQMMRLFMAVLAGKSAGGGTATITFQNVADDTARITATVDTSGNRSAVVLDET